MGTKRVVAVVSLVTLVVSLAACRVGESPDELGSVAQALASDPTPVGLDLHARLDSTLVARWQTHGAQFTGAPAWEVCWTTTRPSEGGCSPSDPDPDAVWALATSPATWAAEDDKRYWVHVRAEGAVAAGAVETTFTPGVHATKAIATGGNHTCALLGRGEVWCWGDASEGQLGPGFGGPLSPEPVLVLGLPPARNITAGAAHTCATVGDGHAWCWGRNDDGQLGERAESAPSVPAPVLGLDRVDFADAGDRHTCARRGDGVAWCWGAGDRGQLGDGETSGGPEPRPVSGLDLVRDLSAGGEHTCATRGDGVAWCWGRGTEGQLGQGVFADSLLPVEVSDLEPVTDLSAGRFHTAARGGFGRAYVWGDGGHGEAGSGASGPATSVPVAVGGLPAVNAVAAGDGFTCARAGNGTAWCWGRANAGQTGQGETAPVMGSGLVVGLDRVHLLVAGGSHACARRADGRVLCWGRGGRGQLGNGGLTSMAGVSEVEGLRGFVAPLMMDSAQSSIIACAVLTDGSLRMWGKAVWGQLGDGEPPENPDGTDRWAAVPVRPLDVHDAVECALGKEHACALSAAGNAWCWGSSHYWPLGIGEAPGTVLYLEPAPVLELEDAITLGRGGTYQYLRSMAVGADGALYVWGDIANLDEVASVFGPPLPEQSKPLRFEPETAPLSAYLDPSRFIGADGRQLSAVGPKAPHSAILVDKSNIDELAPYRSLLWNMTLHSDGHVWVPSMLEFPEWAGCNGPSKPWDVCIKEHTQLIGFSEILELGYNFHDGRAGLRADGRIIAWGAGPLLADDPDATTVVGKDDYQAVKVLDLEGVAHIAIGLMICAVQVSGDTVCWGGTQGEDGQAVNSYTPTPVAELP